MFLVKLQIAPCGRRTLLIASCGWTGVLMSLLLHRFIGHVQGGQGGSAQGNCQGEGLSEVIMIDFAMWCYDCTQTIV